MASPLRLEFAGALYHVTARGNDRRAIFLGDLDADRAMFLDMLALTAERLNWLWPDDLSPRCFEKSRNQNFRVTTGL